MSKYSKVFEMFNKAAKCIRYPAIIFSSGNREIRIHLASKGYIAIKIDGEYMGKLTGPDTTPILYTKEESLAKVICNFLEEPLKEAIIHGKKYNHCCFCRRELDNATSVEMGYGPVCADHYGLPYEKTEYNPLDDM